MKSRKPLINLTDETEVTVLFLGIGLIMGAVWALLGPVTTAIVITTGFGLMIVALINANNRANQVADDLSALIEEQGG